jgi:hypothetical protein
MIVQVQFKFKELCLNFGSGSRSVSFNSYLLALLTWTSVVSSFNFNSSSTMLGLCAHAWACFQVSIFGTRTSTSSDVCIPTDLTFSYIEFMFNFWGVSNPFKFIVSTSILLYVHRVQPKLHRCTNLFALHLPFIPLLTSPRLNFVSTFRRTVTQPY